MHFKVEFAPQKLDKNKKLYYSLKRKTYAEAYAMLSRLFGKNHDKRILEIFALHIGISMKCGVALKTLCDKPSDAMIDHILHLESEGDNLVREMHILIDSVFITRISKEDIVKLVSSLDDILDAMEGVALYMRTYTITAPRPHAHAFARIISQMLGEVEKLVAGMSLWNKKTTTELAFAVSKHEEEADRVLHEALRELDIEVGKARELSEVKKSMTERFNWTVIFEKLERVTDSCEDVADTISSIVRKEAG